MNFLLGMMMFPCVRMQNWLKSLALFPFAFEQRLGNLLFLCSHVSLSLQSFGISTMTLGHSRMCRVLALAFKEEARDHEILHRTWYAWMQMRARSILVEHIDAQGGSCCTAGLACLYQLRPWLKKFVPRLKDFCESSNQLVYVPARNGTKASVVLASIFSQAPVSVVTAKDDDPYVARWMSRKVLKSQMRGQSRTCPSGFNSRCRAHRRAKACQWFQSFLDCFWPMKQRVRLSFWGVYGSSHIMMSSQSPKLGATRRMVNSSLSSAKKAHEMRILVSTWV